MSQALRARLLGELEQLVLIDPHTHINPHSPASTTLADVLGYHYYTELVHSAGAPRETLEAPGLSPRERVERIVAGIAPLENTIQYSWLMEMCRTLFDWHEERLTTKNWESLYDQCERLMKAPDWAASVLGRSKLEAVFLTNDFDDPLTGFDTKLYIPCLRTDDLVFQLAQPDVRERLQRASGTALTSWPALRQAIASRFEHFVAHGARACAISLPPDFVARRLAASDAIGPVGRAFSAGADATAADRMVLAQAVFWLLAELCAEYHLPFDLMIGVNRAVYTGGVYQGQDLFDSRVSLLQYRELFNAFPQVTFPISVLASATNQELVSHAWIFPNVVTHGHWWYSNTPAYIEHDTAARLEAVPATKQMGYYSDMYKLEFALPKFAMYKRVLAKVLAERFVVDRGWSEERAVELGRRVLRGNVERVFFGR